MDLARTHNGRNTQVEGSLDSFLIHSQPPPVRPPQVPPNNTSFLHIILLQRVDLENTHLLSRIMDTPLPKMTATLRVRLVVPGAP